MKKISIKNLYLLLIICIGLICLGIGSTYAVFTTSAEIDSPIVLNSNLTYDSNIIETIEVSLLPGETKETTINVTNSSSTNLNYIIWYIDEGYDIGIAKEENNDTGVISSNENINATIYIKNNSSENVTVLLGVSSSKNDIVLSSNMKSIEYYYNEYQVVEYLASSGTQYIELDYAPKTNTWVETYLRFSENNFDGTAHVDILGVTDVAGEDYEFSANFGSGEQYDTLFNWVTEYGGATTGDSTYAAIKNENYSTKQYYRHGNGLVQWGEVAVTIPDKPYDNEYSMLIYGRKIGNTGQNVPFDAHENMYIYDYFNIYEDDELIINLVPVYRKFDKKTGLYDTISNKFYETQGTGELIIGNEHEYQIVEYLESSGTQYIELDYAPKTNTWIETYLRFSENNYNGTSNVEIFGVCDATEQDIIFSANFGGGSTQHNILFNWVTIYNGPTTGTSAFYINNNNYFTKQYYRMGDGLAQWGETAVDLPEKPYDNEANLVIFGINEPYLDRIRPFNAHENMYIYDYFNIYEDETLIMKLIPAYRKSDQKTGLYDLINSKFYPNGGSGEFIIGDNIKQSIIN